MEKVETKADMRTIYERMADVMADITPIAKSRINKEQNYPFRGIDDVYNMLQPLFGKHGIFCTTKSEDIEYLEGASIKGNKFRVYRVQLTCTFIGRMGDSITTSMKGEAFDYGDKGIYKAYSNALKYIMFQAFCIPTDELKDAEVDSYNAQEPLKKQPTKAIAKETKAIPKEHAEHVKLVVDAFNKYGASVDAKQPVWAELKDALASKDYEKVKDLIVTIESLAKLPSNEKAK